MSEENRTIARRSIEEVWNQGKLAAIDELYDPNYVGHAPPETMKGRLGYKELATKYRTAFPDIHFTIDDMIDAGDRVVTRWTTHSTHKGELSGIRATGKRVTITGTSIVRVVSGRIAEEWTNWDTLGMLQQVGAVPAGAKAGGGA